MIKTLLNIKNLNFFSNKIQILKNLNLKIKFNEIHIILGPNGSGKSTLCNILVGHPNYTNITGELIYKYKNLKSLTCEKRAQKGIFLCFQQPFSINGLNLYSLFNLIYLKKYQKLFKIKFNSLIPTLDSFLLFSYFQKILKIKNNLFEKDFNYNLSGGEKKKNEILQLLILEPNLIILDELDSGLDIENIKYFYEYILNNKLFNTSLLIITHQLKILKYFKPNYIHILNEGTISKTGNLELIPKIEKFGYTFLN
uniref:Iron-sulfur cluster formation ABC transporter ATP-binding subunit n=1 Tax=Spumella sp. NIES-1846 TaxID=2490549 RepID=A0A455REH3_9STRA|nr:Iron-sulfur cluster formation ABC transporter ATP-binding subunit [Spumella sp. NIES-1846]